MAQASTSGFFTFAPPAWIEVTGEDAPTFLQSQFSADLRVNEGTAAPGLWLDHRARLHGESIVLRTGPEAFILYSLTTPAGKLLAKLESHVIADEVEFEDRTAEVRAALFFDGLKLPQLRARLGGRAPEAGAVLYPDGSYVFTDPRLGENVVVWVSSPETIEALGAEARTAGLEELTREGFEFRRLRARWPRIPAEAGEQETVAEAGLEAWCSLTKGCYLGQEVVNRQARLGRAARHLVLVNLERGASDIPEVPCPLLTDDGSTAGELRAVATFHDTGIGLAVIKAKHLGRVLHPADAPDLKVEVSNGG